MKTTKGLLGARIKELRKRRGLSQEQLAEKIGVDPKHLSRIEVGRGFPSLEALDNIARSLDVDIKDFFAFEHLETVESVKQAIFSMIETAREEDLRKILRLITAVMK